MEQPSLFPEQLQPAPLSAEEMAVHIAVHAKTYESTDQTSQAAIDQGWGPEKAVLPPSSPVAQRRSFEVPGRNRGRINSYDQPVTATEAQRGMTLAQIEYQRGMNRAGAEAVRAALNRDKAS